MCVFDLITKLLIHLFQLIRLVLLVSLLVAEVSAVAGENFLLCHFRCGQQMNECAKVCNTYWLDHDEAMPTACKENCVQLRAACVERC